MRVVDLLFSIRAGGVGLGGLRTKKEELREGLRGRLRLPAVRVRVRLAPATATATATAGADAGEAAKVRPLRN